MWKRTFWCDFLYNWVMGRKHIPNMITISRLVLSVAFFMALNFYRYPDGSWVALLLGFVLFIVAAVTDAIDGHYARKWKVESKFGRIMDPFCDKVLVLGGFIYLAGPRFVDPTVQVHDTFFYNILPGNLVTGIYPWMVALILSRELLVTVIRGEIEGSGGNFQAKAFGKWKMILQSICIPTVLAAVFFLANFSDFNEALTAGIKITRDVLVYLTVLITVWSAWPYITGAAKVLKKED